MKKIISFLVVSLTLLFSVSAAKWKATDTINEKKLEKLIFEYNLQKQPEINPAISMYISEDNTNWIYIYKDGSEENNDKNVITIAFLCLDGVFDSCTKYGGFTSFSSTKSYMYSVITEKESAIVADDYYHNGWHWNNPKWVFNYMFFRRLQAFNTLTLFKNNYNFSIPEDVSERYQYFTEWYSNNSSSEDIINLTPKEIKKYQKEHKTK